MGSDHGVWTPGTAFCESTNLFAYLRWLKDERGRVFADYSALQQWSVADPDAFWRTLWDWFEIDADGSIEQVRSTTTMPGCLWFTGTRLNFAEHMLRYGREHPDEPAIIHKSEVRPTVATTWGELASMVRRLATALRERGVEPGDRVVAYAPNIMETLVAMLAATSIGAIWASASPEFGPQTVLDRFSQLEPVVLIAADGYRFGGRDFDKGDDLAQVVAGLPGLKIVVRIDNIGSGGSSGIADLVPWAVLLDRPDPAADFSFARVEANAPLWILFSSGTTGAPKAIVQSHVGVLLELYKLNAFHADARPGDRCFFYATTSWMVWNALVSVMLVGAVPILYDGHPASPPDLLWQLCDEVGASSFGASPTFLQMMQKGGIVPKERFSLGSLRTIILSGSPATPENFAWVYEAVKPDIWITAQSGGTEFCSGLVGGVPLLPVRSGRMQARCLGMAVEAWEADGSPANGGAGELVVVAPCPSMPLRLWGDDDGSRYREAYFDFFPGIWRHGDFIAFDPDGSCVIAGRSDATLNRYGIRIGAAEIYNIVGGVEEVADSIVLGIEMDNGEFWMPLFVKLVPGARLDEALQNTIRKRLSAQGSPRHVPDAIIQAPGIPYTLTGKKMEIPLRNLLKGAAPDAVMRSDMMMDPTVVGWYEKFARARAAVQTGLSG